MIPSKITKLAHKVKDELGSDSFSSLIYSKFGDVQKLRRKLFLVFRVSDKFIVGIDILSISQLSCRRQNPNFTLIDNLEFIISKLREKITQTGLMNQLDS